MASGQNDNLTQWYGSKKACWQNGKVYRCQIDILVARWNCMSKKSELTKCQFDPMVW